MGAPPLLRPEGARELLRDCFPLREQVDVMVSKFFYARTIERRHPSGAITEIFALQTHDRKRLAYSPKSEDTEGDTDVQTIWDAPVLRSWECVRCGQTVLCPAMRPDSLASRRVAS
eukprot:gene11918-21464_t